MPLVGHIYKITDALKAFVPIILGSEGGLQSGFVPWSGTTVIAHYYWWPLPSLPPLPYYSTFAKVARDGSFSVMDSPLLLAPVYVNLIVRSGVTIYRSDYMPLAFAQDTELNFWVYVDKLPIEDGISAGTISQVVAGQGLPDNTTITAGGPYGLNFSGSTGQVSLNFNIWIAPDTSPNLNNFLDLSINGWDINVGWPESWFESADDVLNKIKSSIAGAGSSANQAVLKRMEGILESQEGLDEKSASDFLKNEVVVTFSGIVYPKKYSWGIGDTSNKTIVLVANPCIGYPRAVNRT